MFESGEKTRAPTWMSTELVIHTKIGVISNRKKTSQNGNVVIAQECDEHFNDFTKQKELFSVKKFCSRNFQFESTILDKYNQGCDCVRNQITLTHSRIYSIFHEISDIYKKME